MNGGSCLWGVQVGAKSPLVESPEAPDLKA